MLQGFYWDSYTESSWKNLESQADELSEFFNLIWIPQSANCGSNQSMGYDDLYWFNNYTSSFGNETQLRSMINTFKEKGLGTIADVVINHRKNVSNWVDFPKETYKGEEYQLVSTDICADDDGGKTKEWASQNGYELSANKDGGEGWDGMRDLDHNSENVQKNVLAYLDLLLNDFGYAGVRYDMTKGYAAKFTGKYNSESGVQYSVGEYWDGDYTKLQKWVDGTKVDGMIQSATFDFATRYIARNVFNGINPDNNKKVPWSDIANQGLAKTADYGRYAITFCENHDTQYRSSDSQNDPIKKNIAAANAYILLINGTPCVFLKHWIDYKDEIKQLIYARKMAGITNDGSSYSIFAGNSSSNFAALRTKDNANCDVVVAFGEGYKGHDDYVQILSGENYQVYMEKKAESPWISVPSKEISSAIEVTLSAISTDPDAKLVYTLDGTNPTSTSKSVNSGKKIAISGACTLMVGLLSNGEVKNIQTRTYTEPAVFEPYDIDVYVCVDQVKWNKVNFWTWGGDESHGPKNKNWPGDEVTKTVEKDGKLYYYQTYRINSAKDCVNFVWSTGSGSPQTEDVSNVSETSYYEVLNEKTGDGKYKVQLVSSSPTGIDSVTDSENPSNGARYNLSGQQVNSEYKGLYIEKGKKKINSHI